jgi:hypothetical protein
MHVSRHILVSRLTHFGPYLVHIKISKTPYKSERMEYLRYIQMHHRQEVLWKRLDTYNIFTSALLIGMQELVLEYKTRNTERL